MNATAARPPIPGSRRPRRWVLITTVIVIALVVAGITGLLVRNTFPPPGGLAPPSASAPPSVTDTIPVGKDLLGVAVSPDGHHAYITNSSLGSGAGSVLVIDTGSNKVTDTIPVGNEPSGVAVSPDGHHAYITNVRSGSVSVIDTGVG